MSPDPPPTAAQSMSRRKGEKEKRRVLLGLYHFGESRWKKMLKKKMKGVAIEKENVRKK